LLARQATFFFDPRTSNSLERSALSRKRPDFPAGCPLIRLNPDFRQLVVDVYEHIDIAMFDVLRLIPREASNQWNHACKPTDTPTTPEVCRFNPMIVVTFLATGTLRCYDERRFALTLNFHHISALRGGRQYGLFSTRSRGSLPTRCSRLSESPDPVPARKPRPRLLAYHRSVLSPGERLEPLCP
jgi:hypothetical protein